MTAPTPPVQVNASVSCRAAKKSAHSPPMIGAIAPQVALTTLLAARKAVACPDGDSFMTMLPEARATPAVATPISTWMTTSR